MAAHRIQMGHVRGGVLLHLGYPDIDGLFRAHVHAKLWDVLHHEQRVVHRTQQAALADMSRLTLERHALEDSHRKAPRGEIERRPRLWADRLVGASAAAFPLVASLCCNEGVAGRAFGAQHPGR